MKLTKIPGLGRFGYFVDDVDLMTISDEEWMEIGKLHMQNFVTIIRNANCTKDRYGELIDKLGTLRPSAITSLKYKKKYKEINRNKSEHSKATLRSIDGGLKQQ